MSSEHWFLVVSVCDEWGKQQSLSFSNRWSAPREHYYKPAIVIFLIFSNSFFFLPPSPIYFYLCWWPWPCFKTLEVLCSLPYQLLFPGSYSHRGMSMLHILNYLWNSCMSSRHLSSLNRKLSHSPEMSETERPHVTSLCEVNFSNLHQQQ